MTTHMAFAHRERVLFIGTQFSNLYTAVDTPGKTGNGAARAAAVARSQARLQTCAPSQPSPLNDAPALAVPSRRGLPYTLLAFLTLEPFLLWITLPSVTLRHLLPATSLAGKHACAHDVCRAWRARARQTVWRCKQRRMLRGCLPSAF